MQNEACETRKKKTHTHTLSQSTMHSLSTALQNAGAAMVLCSDIEGELCRAAVAASGVAQWCKRVGRRERKKGTMVREREKKKGEKEHHFMNSLQFGRCRSRCQPLLRPMHDIIAKAAAAAK